MTFYLLLGYLLAGGSIAMLSATLSRIGLIIIIIAVLGTTLAALGFAARWSGQRIGAVLVRISPAWLITIGREPFTYWGLLILLSLFFAFSGPNGLGLWS